MSAAGGGGNFRGTAMNKGMILPGTTKANRNQAASNAAAAKVTANAAAGNARRANTGAYLNSARSQILGHLLLEIVTGQVL